MKRILVTGSNGFIGKHLVKYLKERYEVCGLDRWYNGQSSGSEVDDLLPEDIEKFDAIIHLAAQTSVWNENDVQVIKDNVASFSYIFSLCRIAEKRFIYASSSCAVNVTSTYGWSKKVGDELAMMEGWRGCVGLRLHNVYGKGARSDTLLGRCLSQNKILLYNNGLNWRHFTYIDDVCRIFEQALTMEGGIYNVANPELDSTADFVKEVAKYKDLKVELFDQKREKDKVTQVVDTMVKNLLDNSCVKIQDGIRMVFE